MDINCSYSISFYKLDDVKEIHQWILDNKGFEDYKNGLPVFHNEKGDCISLEEFTASLQTNGSYKVYKVEDISMLSDTIIDAIRALAKDFPQLCFDAHIDFYDYNASVGMVGEFMNEDGVFSEDIEWDDDEDYDDEDIE